MIKHDGTPFWAHLEATAVYETGGTPVIRIVLSDISARKKAEQAQLACELDPALAPPDVLSACKGLRAVLNGTLPRFSMEYPCHSPTQQRWFMMNVLPLGSLEHSGAVIAHNDITEIKRLGQILQDNNVELERARFEADKANQAKSDFLSSMSHELRTPLNLILGFSILGFAQLIESGITPPTPVQKKSIDKILKAGWYLLDLINEILDLAQIESGKLSLTQQALPLAQVLQECQAMIETQAQQRGIGVTFPRFETPCLINAERPGQAGCHQPAFQSH